MMEGSVNNSVDLEMISNVTNTPKKMRCGSNNSTEGYQYASLESIDEQDNGSLDKYI